MSTKNSAVDVEGVVEGVEDVQTELLLSRRDAMTDEIADAVEEHD